jgi:hypothetical protein
MLEFRDAEGAVFSMPVSGAADNCILTTHAYLEAEGGRLAYSLLESGSGGGGGGAAAGGDAPAGSAVQAAALALAAAPAAIQLVGVRECGEGGGEISPPRALSPSHSTATAVGANEPPLPELTPPLPTAHAFMLVAPSGTV